VSARARGARRARARAHQRSEGTSTMGKSLPSGLKAVMAARER
jgi:hypothetical protein